MKENKNPTEKKNSMFKNIGIVMSAWVKKYPTALLFIPVYLACRLVSPFLSSLLSSKAIGAITVGNPKQFLITVLGLLGIIFICSAISNILGSVLMGQRIYTRLGVFTRNLFEKALTTDYQNVELQKNQKILGKGANSLSSNYNEQNYFYKHTNIEKNFELTINVLLGEIDIYIDTKEIDTEEKAYWLGFILADGYINEDDVEELRNITE